MDVEDIIGIMGNDRILDKVDYEEIKNKINNINDLLKNRSSFEGDLENTIKEFMEISLEKTFKNEKDIVLDESQEDVYQLNQQRKSSQSARYLAKNEDLKMNECHKSLNIVKQNKKDNESVVNLYKDLESSWLKIHNLKKYLENSQAKIKSLKARIESLEKTNQLLLLENKEVIMSQKIYIEQITRLEKELKENILKTEKEYKIRETELNKDINALKDLGKRKVELLDASYSWNNLNDNKQNNKSMSNEDIKTSQNNNREKLKIFEVI